ncbi:MAG: hypothetical protein JXR75_03020 [Rhodobacteraceae bacterium]|nr:hypothetical protein [Paracoccaceae bacterium]
MAAALTLCTMASACVQTAVPQARGPGSAAPLRVTNNGTAFAMDEGAAARRVAEATCAARGQSLRPSIYDRFDAGAWVYVGGCA